MRSQLLILVLALGCGTDPLAPDFDRRLTHFGGCGDVVFFAVDAADEILVTFVADGLLADARQVGTATTTVIEFPSDDVELRVEQGSRISDATCDDVIENSGPDVQRSWIAVSGTATVRMRPLEESIGGRGDLVLEDVVFATGGDEVTLGRLEWLDVSVGWYPG